MLGSFRTSWKPRGLTSKEVLVVYARCDSIDYRRTMRFIVPGAVLIPEDPHGDVVAHPSFLGVVEEVSR